MRLTIDDHRRDLAGLTYVYPVLSRRAKGVSVGINLNPNHACNWRCIYCQVPGLRRGAAPPIDLGRLAWELELMLRALRDGSVLELDSGGALPPIVDVAFSGNGEPTSAKEFPHAVAVVRDIVDTLAWSEKPRLRLITNGSLVDRPAVQTGLTLLAQAGGEAWFKIDVVGSRMREINGVSLSVFTIERRLKHCAALCPTWVQTCVFKLDGKIVFWEWLDDYLRLVEEARAGLLGIHLYGLARPSCQPEAHRLKRLQEDEIIALAEALRKGSGLTVIVSP